MFNSVSEVKKSLIERIFCLKGYIRDLYAQDNPDNKIDIIKAEAELEAYQYLLEDFD